MEEQSKINVRKMENRDVPLISQMFVEQGWSPRDLVLKNYIKEQKEGIRIALVAEIEERIVGYVTLIELAQNGPFINVYPEIADFNVFEKYRKKGIGNVLLDEIEKEAKKNYKVITLGVGIHKEYGPAQRIYIKRGYIPDGTGAWYNDKNIDVNEACLNNNNLILYLSKNLY